MNDGRRDINKRGSLEKVGSTDAPRFSGPQSENSFFSGMSARSSGSRQSPKGPLVDTAAMRVREQQEWSDAERDKEMFLKRMRAQVPKAGAMPAQDSLHELPDLQGRRPKPPSESGTSDRSPKYDRDPGRGGKSRGHGQVVDSQSHSSKNSGRSGFSFASFRSAISDMRNYGRRDNKKGRRNSSQGSMSPRRDDSYSEDLPPRDYDRYVDRGSPRDYDRGHDRSSPRDYDRGYERSSPRDYDRGIDRGLSRENEHGYERSSPRDYDRGIDRGLPRDYDRGYERSSPRDYDRGIDRGSPRDYDRGYERGSSRDFSQGGSSRDYDRRYERRQNRDYDRERREYERDRGSPRDCYPARSPRDKEPLSIKDRDHRDLMALRDRDDNSSYRGSSHRSASRRSLSRNGSVGAEARVPRGAVIPARHGPGMMNRNTRDPMETSSQGSSKGRRLKDEFDGKDDSLVTNDLEAKLRTAQRNLADVQHELDEQKQERDRIQAQLKRKDMPGGSMVQHQLMQDLIALREHCLEIENKKVTEEDKAKKLESELKLEQDQRKEDIRSREESRQMQKDLEERIDQLGKLAKEHEGNFKLEKKESEQIKSTLEMIQSERDETLELLRRAVTQKERLKADKQREGQQANDKLEKIQGQQKVADNRVRELLSNVDSLLGKFSAERDGSSSSSTSGTQLQLELMKIRDHIRHLVTANEDTRQQIAVSTSLSVKKVDTARR